MQIKYSVKMHIIFIVLCDLSLSGCGHVVSSSVINITQWLQYRQDSTVEINVQYRILGGTVDCINVKTVGLLQVYGYSTVNALSGLLAHINIVNSVVVR